MGKKIIRSTLTDADKFKVLKFMEDNKRSLIGKSVLEMAGVIEAHTGLPLTRGNMVGLLRVVPIPIKKKTTEKPYPVSRIELKCIVQCIQELYAEIGLAQRSCLEAIRMSVSGLETPDNNGK